MRVRRPLELSLFHLLDHYPERPTTVGDRLRDAVSRAALAESLGFDGVWFAEHHFRDFGTMPNPAVLLAAVAGNTRGIRLGSAVAVLPFRHPVQVAEDYLIVDQLSRGRLNLGVGSGIIPWEFAGFGVDIESKAERFREALETLRPLLRGEAARYHGRYVQVDGVGANVPPAQPGGPPIYVASNRVEHALLAGRNGDGLLTLVSPETADLSVVDERLSAYRRGQADGREGRGDIAVAIMAHVAESDAAAEACVRPAMLRFLKAHGASDTEQACAAYERMLKQGTGLFGSAETVAAGLSDLIGRGVDHVVLWMDFGGIRREVLDATMARMARAVRPRLDAAGDGIPTVGH